MRLLITTDAIGGVWTHALELARAFSARGARVALATLGGELSEGRRAEVRGLGVPVYESAFRLAWMPDPWEDHARAAAWLSTVERRFRPDVVCLNHEGHGKLPWRAAVVTVVHSCVLSWWEAVASEPAPPAWDRYRAAVEAGLAGSDLVVTPSEWMLRTVRRIYAPAVPSRAIANGRSASEFVVGAKKPFVLAAGRLWDAGKNAACLATAAAALPWTVYAAGAERGPDGQSAPSDGLRRLGTLTPSQLRAWYSRAAVFAHPAVYEPFGLAPLEAALSGCALVLADLESLRETWDDAAVYVPPRDPDALAAALRRLLSDEFRAGALGRRARARALRFSPERMADAYEQAFAFARARRAEARSGRAASRVARSA